MLQIIVIFVVTPVSPPGQPAHSDTNYCFLSDTILLQAGEAVKHRVFVNQDNKLLTCILLQLGIQMLINIKASEFMIVVSRSKSLIKLIELLNFLLLLGFYLLPTPGFSVYSN